MLHAQPPPNQSFLVTLMHRVVNPGRGAMLATQC
ncbi:hypothetical protein BOS5A_170052 [Bosea sp. EC-HK365B]|nr:hypothetical protein BOSE7B_40052 [Bosea sp. 7B]VVT56631.1 hypothetical protein BOS5A_170052 [Bosea sp. EC-HK365B]VXC72930.1 hypothetical protein BOSE127_40293 [Bosea sp. 127]